MKINEIRAIVVDVDDNEAIILMVDSNCQRSKILPSEKAFSYKIKLNTIKRQGKSKAKIPLFGRKTQPISAPNSNDIKAEQYVLKALSHYKKYIERKNSK